jgi:hypothetical protein
MMSCNNVNVEPTVIGGGDGSTAYDAFGRLRVSQILIPYLILKIDTQ